MVVVPFIGAEFDELEEPPSDAVDPLGVLLIGVEVDTLEEVPFDPVNPTVEVGCDEPAEAPHAASVNTRIHNAVIAMVFFIRSPFYIQGAQYIKSIQFTGIKNVLIS